MGWRGGQMGERRAPPPPWAGPRAPGLVLVGVLALLLAACTSSGSRPPSAAAPGNLVPRGWETYVYGRAAISAPSTWAVRRNQNCPNTSAPGTLLLGLPTVLDHCAEHHSPPNVVMLNSVPTGSERQPAACQRLERFNGLPVFVTPCAPGGDPSGEVLWSVPTLGAQVQARGSGSIAVIHTLRKASPTPSAVSASGPLRVRITVARTRVPAGTPIRGVALITNSSTPVTVEACAADGWFDVGLSNGDLSSSPGPGRRTGRVVGHPSN